MEASKTYPTLALRVSPELLAACKQAGPKAVRELLNKHLLNKEGEQAIVEQPIVKQTAKARPIVTQVVEQNVVEQPEVVTQNVEQTAVVEQIVEQGKEGPTGDRFALMRAEAERKRAAKKAAIEALPPTLRPFVA